ncbi:MAG: tetratricopeptide repeat protein [Gammaproteobacteria bacterium]
MSLLMDALKKAEQEKKEAAKRLRESEAIKPTTVESRDDKQPAESEPASDAGTSGPHAIDSESPTMELSLAPIEERRREMESPATEETGEYEDMRISDDGNETEDITGDQSLHLAIDDPGMDADEEDSEDAARREQDSSRIEEMDREESAADPDQTFHDFELDDSMNRAMFEETVQGEAPVSGDRAGGYDETLPGVSALQMAADIGSEDQPTPVAAETVFTAGTTTRQGSPGVKWVLIGTTVVMIAAAAVWYYYTVTPINRKLPSPMVARGVESVTPVEVPAARVPPQPVQSGSFQAQPGESVDAGTISGASEPTDTGTAASETEQQAAAAEEKPVDETRQKTAGTTAEASPEAADATAAETADEGDKETEAVAVREQPPAALPETLEPPPSLIRISRSKTPERQGILLNEAYRSYKNGDYRAAAEAYEKVLQQYPDNRDALLGLAALALKRDDAEQALGIYARILRLNPRDNLARAALINLSRTTDRRRAETTIRQMLQDNPDVAYLHFALGNIHAAQSRWPDAQQAYFDAFRLDDGNADYAMNLAVSLDRLGKSRNALEYYRNALELAANGGANFDPATLQKRIAILEGAAQP